MKHETILYISDHAASSDSVMVELEAKGYQIVSTDSPSQGSALLYIMHSVAAVVLQYQPEDRTWFELTQSLRTIRPDVPIILLSRDPILYLPPWVDACVGDGTTARKGSFCGAHSVDRRALRSAQRTMLHWGLGWPVRMPGNVAPAKPPDFSLLCYLQICSLSPLLIAAHTGQVMADQDLLIAGRR